MVPAALSWSASMAAVRGPMSRIMSEASTSATALTATWGLTPFLRSSKDVVDVTTSTGIGTAAPRAFMASITLRASFTKSASASDLPIGNPSASRKVFAIPPPTIS